MYSLKIPLGKALHGQKLQCLTCAAVRYICQTLEFWSCARQMRRWDTARDTLRSPSLAHGSWLFLSSQVEPSLPSCCRGLCVVTLPLLLQVSTRLLYGKTHTRQRRVPPLGMYTHSSHSLCQHPAACTSQMWNWDWCTGYIVRQVLLQVIGCASSTLSKTHSTSRGCASPPSCRACRSPWRRHASACRARGGGCRLPHQRPGQHLGLGPGLALLGQQASQTPY